jgi:hypothetical protein
MRQATKMENKEIDSDERPTDEKNAESADEETSHETNTSELNLPQWSVVSFEKSVAGNLTYAEAIEKLNELDAQKIAGLCIITDEAAERLN